MQTRWLLAAASLALMAVPAARADDRVIEFLHVLQEHGYGDLAIYYLNLTKQSNMMPAELADVFDLEMANSLRAAAKGAYNAKEAARLTAEAKKHLDKFFQEKPDHPEASAALVSWGMFSMDQAMRWLQQAEAAPVAAKERYLCDARSGFHEAQARFTQAVERLAARIAATPTAAPGRNNAGPNLHARLVADWLNARMQVGQADYHIAKTYADVNSPSRRDWLCKAAKIFDDVFQRNRPSPTTGLYAHIWDGRCAEELGDLDRAKDIYEEILGDMPDPPGPRTAPDAFKRQLQDIAGMEPLLTQAAYYRLMLEKKNRVEFIKQARGWLDTYGEKRLRMPGTGRTITIFQYTDGYQGVAIELARMELAVAADPSVDKNRQEKLRADAIKTLQEASKVPSYYQREIILLLRKQEGKGADVTESDVAQAATFAEAKTLGEEAQRQHRWEVAKKAYEKALELAGE